MLDWVLNFMVKYLSIISSRVATLNTWSFLELSNNGMSVVSLEIPVLINFKFSGQSNPSGGPWTVGSNARTFRKLHSYLQPWNNAYIDYFSFLFKIVIGISHLATHISHILFKCPVVRKTKRIYQTRGRFYVIIQCVHTYFLSPIHLGPIFAASSAVTHLFPILWRLWPLSSYWFLDSALKRLRMGKNLFKTVNISIVIYEFKP